MTVYYCEIPAGILVTGTNTITLGVTSTRNGTDWLSPNYVGIILITKSSCKWLTISLNMQILDFIELYY
jgi:hypothetical protein